MEANASKSAFTWVVMTVTSLFLIDFLLLGTVVVRDTLVLRLANKVMYLKGLDQFIGLLSTKS
jgi:hypothetical protein